MFYADLQPLSMPSPWQWQRGRRLIDDRPVLLKAIAQTATREVQRLQREYALTRNYQSDGLLTALELFEDAEQCTLVLEDPGGKPLQTLLDNGGIPLISVLRLGRKLAQTLAGLHQRGLVHRDLQPAHIWIDAHSDAIWLHGLGNASLMRREMTSSRAIERLQLDPHYLAPEQSGRINRYTDYRADYYSLGVLLFQMLCGRPPFMAQSQLELIHGHIALPPPELNTLAAGIPPTVVRIVSKLLAKAAEDRYQSGWGIAADLDHCLAELTVTGSISDFEPGQHDIPLRFELPQQLCGRDAEADELNKHLEEIWGGAGQVVMVAGPAGVGKTTLILELRRLVLQRGGFFISGKCNQSEYNRPYQVLRQALQSLIHRLLSLDAESLSDCQRRLKTVLTDSFGVITELAPDFVKLVGETQPPSSLEPAQARNRLHHCVQQFLQTAAGAGHPIVLFIDDLQWIDTASLELLDYLVANLPEYLLLLGAYRNNEIGEESPLLQMLRLHDRDGRRVKTLTLRPLKLAETQQFIAQALRSRLESLPSLAQLAYQKTAGNPLYLKIFLESLDEQGWMEFKPGLGWRWDSAAIDASQAIGSAVDLLVGALQRLPQTTRRMIATAAMLGSEFAAGDIGLVCSNEPESEPALVEAQLQPACDSGVLISSGQQTYRFVHDRVQQTAYQLIPAQERPQRHQHIARMLSGQAEQDENNAEQYVFAIAEHINRAQLVLSEPAEREWALQANLQAARRAHSLNAFAPAHAYFRRVIDLLDAGSWDDRYSLTLTLYREAATAAYLSADFATARQLAEQLRRHARTIPESIEGYQIPALIAFSESQPEQALQNCLEALAMLGIEVTPYDSVQTLTRVAMELAQRLDELMEKPPETLPLIEAPHYDAALGLLHTLVHTVGWSNIPVLERTICEAVKLMLEHGVQRHSAHLLLAFAAMRILILQDAAGSARTAEFALAQQQRRHDAPGLEPMANFTADGFVYSLITPLQLLYPRFLETHRLAIECGDLFIAGSCLYQHSVLSLHAGRSLAELEPLIRSYHTSLIGMNNRLMATVLEYLLQLVAALRGDTGATAPAVDQPLNDTSPVGLRVVRSQLMTLHLLRQSPTALASVLAAGSVAQPELPAIPNEYYRCLILLDCYAAANAARRRHYLALVDEFRQRLKTRAHLCAENYQHKFDLIEAERLRVLGRPDEAVSHYIRAIEGARRNGFIQEQALAAELAADCHLELQQPFQAGVNLQIAMDCYQRWGADGKCRKLRERYAALLNDYPRVTPLPSVPVPVLPAESGADPGSSDTLDLQSLQQAALALSRVLDLNQLLQQLMTLALQSTGAQSGFLISEQQDNLLIEVSAVTRAGALQIERRARGIDDSEVPTSIVRYIARTLSPVLLADAATSEQFAGDPYLLANQVKSIFCLPLHNEHSQHTAFLYLEHRQLADAFSSAHVAAAQLLATQATAALSNARLHHKLQQEVGRHRQTATELQQALAEVATLKEKISAENVYLQQEIQSTHNFEEIIGQSKTLHQLLQQVELVAPTDASVLILGETGTGKELIARAVHQRSPRRQRPLIKVNCAALPVALIESELFGYEKGAFTGASSRQIGRFELADGGTLFLDEIGDMPLELQIKLLRVLQEGEFERLGSGQTRKVDVRVIAATNRELERLTQQGQFRADLYYRLNTFPLLLPPLRERREDIPLLIWFFIDKHQSRLNRHIEKVPEAAMQALQNYDWPGNIRELENVIERVLILSHGDTLLLNDTLLPAEDRLTTPATLTREYGGLRQIEYDYQKIERSHILSVLKQCDWKVQGNGNAADRLGLAPSTLRWKMRKLGITRSR